MNFPNYVNQEDSEAQDIFAFVFILTKPLTIPNRIGFKHHFSSPTKAQREERWGGEDSEAWLILELFPIENLD